MSNLSREMIRSIGVRVSFPLLASLALSLLGGACTRDSGRADPTPGSDARPRAVVDEGSFPSGAVTCGPKEGSLYVYSFSPNPLGVKKEDIALKGDFRIYDPQKTRLEVCLNEDTQEAFPKRVVTWINEGGAGAWSARARVLTREDAAPNASFAAALLEDDFSKVDIRFLATDTRETSWFLKGGKTAAGGVFLTLSPFVAARGDATTVAYGAKLAKDGAQPVVEVGLLEEGDPFIPKQDCQERVVTVPGVKIAYEFCKWGSHGTRISYEFKKVSIEDSTGAAPFSFAAAGAEADRVAQVSNTHHSFNDALTIDAGSRRYVVSPRETPPADPSSEEKMELRIEADTGVLSTHALRCGYVYECGARVTK